MRSPLAAAVAVALAALVPATAQAQTLTSSPNLKHVTNVKYDLRYAQTKSYGTDIEFAEIRGKQYALAGSYVNGLQIMDLSDPASPVKVGVYDCGITQGDVQVFKRQGKTYITYTADSTPTAARAKSACYEEATALGFKPRMADGRGLQGTFIADISDPTAPKTVSFVPVALGSHNQTVHPSGDFLYNSNSELITNIGGSAIEVFDIRDFSAPKLVTTFPLIKVPGLGNDSHDITFNEDGTRAYSAALSHEEIINTEDPAKPTRISTITDPTINVFHQSDPITIGGREFLVIEDEFAGAVGTNQCPNGGVHFYDITDETNPKKVGYWNVDQVRPTATADRSCTAHVFRLHDEQDLMTIAFYNGGVAVVDLKGVADGDAGDDQLVQAGAKQLAFGHFPNSNAWSAKTPEIQKDGDFFLYANDIDRGLDVFEYDAQAGKSKATGRWMTAGEAAVSLPRASTTALKDYQMFCLLNGQS
jgi:hypothetical protein